MAVLNNNNGYFSDDQYAAFDPANAVYNGTSDQKYLQRRCRVWLEDWYNGDFDNAFFGRLTRNGFARSSEFLEISLVNISAMDKAEELESHIVDKATAYEDKKISDSTEADSLIHLIAREASKHKVYNYLANSSFENATITNSWVQGSNTTLSRQADPLFGTYCGQIVCAGGQGETYQTVTFDGSHRLSVGDTYTFFVWLKSSAAVSVTGGVQIEEHDSGGNNDETTADISISGGEGWVKHTVSHTITDSDSDRLIARVIGDDGDTIKIDGAMLINNDRAIHWFVHNDNDGSAGSVGADEVENDSYETMGFDVDYVNVTHPWRRVEAGETVWSSLKRLANATAPLYLGFDENGTFRFRCVLATGYSDKVPRADFTEDDVEPGINTNLTMATANQVIGTGVRIIVPPAGRQYYKPIWRATACGAFDIDATGTILEESIANGDSWPDPDTYGEFWARYQEGLPMHANQQGGTISDPSSDPWWQTTLKAIGFLAKASLEAGIRTFDNAYLKIYGRA
jgi:hypothetical protein